MSTVFDPRGPLLEHAECWRQKVPLSLSEMLNKYPELLQHPSALLSLVDQDLYFRLQIGQQPHLDDYLSVCPTTLHDQIRRTFEFQQLVYPLPDIPGYVIHRELGRGGCAVVYDATQCNLQRRVALKLDLIQTSRFAHEPTTLARLKHSHIVEIYDTGEVHGQRYFAMELLTGGSLQERLHKGPLPIDEVARIGIQLANALQHAHEQGIIHRDLKPSNILFSREGLAKITDFGLAKRINEVGNTVAGQILGTPAYMAPEQAAGQIEKIGPTTDVFALGATLYAMLTGEAPFRGDSDAETMSHVLNDDPVAIRQLRPRVPRDLETIVQQCLHKQQSRRYASAGEVAADLQRFSQGHPIRARRASLMERGWKLARRRPALVASTLLVLLLVGIGLLLRQLNLRAEQFRQTQTMVAGLRHAKADAVPVWIERLDEHRSDAIALLRQAFDADSSIDERIRLAHGLAYFGEVAVDFLVDTAVPHVPLTPGECRLFVESLRQVSEQACTKLRQAINRQSDPALQARYAAIALHLGDPEPARNLLVIRPDPQILASYKQVFADTYRLDKFDANEFAAAAGNPERRSAFISTYPHWHGELTDLIELLDEETDDSLLSGVCLALGLIAPQEVRDPARSQLHDWLGKIHRNAQRAGAHAAARYALTKWGFGLSAIEPGSQPLEGKNWFVNSVGMTMIRVDPKPFVAGGRLNDYELSHFPHAIRMSRPYLLADREVSIETWNCFLQDDSYTGPRPNKGERGANKEVSPTAAHPVQRVSWLAAVQFCNWLSWREKCQPAYIILDKDDQGKPLPSPEVVLSLHGDGYRLPTQAEWEYACRAGTGTRYCFGDQEDSPLFAESVVTSQMFRRPTNPCGRSMPNAWGFLDMHGNVWEWCWDLSEHSHSWPVVSQDPVGPQYPLVFPPKRVLRGGGVANSAGTCAASASGNYTSSSQFWNAGFRIARSIPHRTDSSLADNMPASKPLRGPASPSLREGNRNRVLSNHPFVLKASSRRPIDPDYCGVDWDYEETYLSDNDLFGYWRSASRDSVACGGKPAIRLTFQTTVAVTRVTVMGCRNVPKGGGLCQVQRCRLTLLNQDGKMILSQESSGSGPFLDFDWLLPTPLNEVKEIVITPTRDTGNRNEDGSIALAEILVD